MREVCRNTHIRLYTIGGKFKWFRTKRQAEEFLFQEGELRTEIEDPTIRVTAWLQQHEQFAMEEQIRDRSSNNSQPDRSGNSNSNITANHVQVEMDSDLETELAIALSRVEMHLNSLVGK